jgi:hypothetical protein
MPCYATGSAEGDAALDAREARQELTRVTRIACELAEAIRGSGQAFWFDRLSKETQMWIREHDKIDKQRRREQNEVEERDRNRRRALKKLTTAERKALGL